MHFFERTYRLLRDFCDSEDDIVSVNIVCEFIQQLVDNNSKAKPIACPDDFISDEKVDIWKTLKRKLSSCKTLDDSVSKNIYVLLYFMMKGRIFSLSITAILEAKLSKN